MKRSILTGLSLVLVAACQDGTSPQSDAPLGLHLPWVRFRI